MCPSAYSERLRLLGRRSIGNADFHLADDGEDRGSNAKIVPAPNTPKSPRPPIFITAIWPRCIVGEPVLDFQIVGVRPDALGPPKRCGLGAPSVGTLGSSVRRDRGANPVGWYEDEVDEHIASLPRAAAGAGGRRSTAVAADGTATVVSRFSRSTSTAICVVRHSSK
jgi:hypothetical protein